jgi:DNA mismatch repair protein MutL
MASVAPTSSIQVLPQHLANQIAAGEVVQRPESVVKELVENAIDAGASHVTVNINGAGKSLIQVIDDGHGMTEEDARLAIERHATSKIRSLDDLERIMTFGFRGEALPSIASVAKVEMRTRTGEQDVATLLRIENGAVDEADKVEGPVGTSISVKNLFYNTPARRQFLKSNATEYRHITDSVQRFVLSYPDVHFTLISDGSTIYDAAPAELPDRIAYLFGERVADSLLPVHEETDLITVTGFVGRPNFAKKSRGEQFLFVNGRYVVSRYLNHAVVSAYENMLDQGAFPMYMLYVNVDPRQVDVNVHPSKLEVKFSNERNIYTILNAIVRRSLYNHDLTPSIAFRDTEAGRAAEGDFSRVRITSPDESGAPPEQKYDSFGSLGRGMEGGAGAAGSAAGGQGGSGGAYRERGGTDGGGSRMDPRQIDDLFRSLNVDAGQSVSPRAAEPERETVILPSERPVSDIQFLWQLHNKYIFTPIKSGLMIIDQHVAHERILYEKALAAMQDAAPFSQQLLFEHSTRVSAGDYALLGEIRAEFEHLGFVLRLAAPQNVTVEAVPQDVRPGMEESILEEMIEQYREYSAAGITDTRHNVAASYGCRAAIKAGDKLSPAEMQNLIDQLFATSNPYVCPHGRPIVIKLSLDELDRRFGRTG